MTIRNVRCCFCILAILCLGFIHHGAAADEATCTVEEVRTFADRAHVRCAERYYSATTDAWTLRYFATPAFDASLTNQLVSLGSASQTAGRLIVTYEAEDESGQAFGCQPHDCRRISAASLPSSGGRQMLDLGAVEGEARTALVYPSITSGPAPAILYFHGYVGTASESAGRIALHNLWPEATVVYAEGTAVSPSGRPSSSSKQGWELRFPHKYALGQRKDLTYVRRLLEALKDQFALDSNKVFAVGHSRGGFFTFSLSELMPKTFSGFAVLGSYSRFGVSLVGLDCYALDSNQAARPRLRGGGRAADPKPVLYMFGKNDTVFANDTFSNGRPPNVPCSNRSDLVKRPGWSPVPHVATWSRHTLDELLFRNRAKKPSGNYWLQQPAHSASQPPSPLVFEAAGSNGAPVHWMLYDGGHSWPVEASGWVVDFFRAL